MTLLDIIPTAPRNPFVAGALLPTTVETRNSIYVFTLLPLTVDGPAMVVVSCAKGTFAGKCWRVPVSDVRLTRTALYVDGDVRLCTTRPLTVNGYAVETWDPCCGCVDGNYPCEYGSAGEGCGY